MRTTAIIFSLLVAFSISAKEYTVAALYWSMNIEGQVAMRKGLEAEVKKINSEAKKKNRPTVKVIPFVAGDGYPGIDNQIKQMNEVVKRNDIDMIIVQPTDNAALIGPLKIANSKNIPVIAYDQYIVEGEITSYITSNNYQAGYLDGEYIASLFDDNYSIKLVLVEYPKVSSTVERVDGFIDALNKEKQKFKILANYEAVEPVSGKKAGKAMLKDFPKKGSIDVVFTINDGGGLSVVDELDKAGRTEIKVATIDGDPQSVKNIKKGRLTVIDSAQFCGEIGRKSMEIGYKHLLGQKVPKKVLVPTFPITKETLDIYPGWLGHVPERFEKKWKPNSYWNNRYKESN